MSRIAIDYTAAFAQGGGIGRYARDITEALSRLEHADEYRLFVSGAARSELPPLPGQEFAWRPTRIGSRWLARIWHRARIPFPIEAFVGRVDLFHATDFFLPPTMPGVRKLLTVHDLSFIRAPEAASPPLRRYLEMVVPRFVERADHIHAVSQATKDDLIALYGTGAEKITVVHSGVDDRYRRVKSGEVLGKALAKYGLEDVDYVLSVGTIQPRKNYARVIRGLRQLRDRGQTVHYAIAGGRGWLEDEMYRTIRETDMADRVRVLGFVAEEDLPALYSGAEAVLAVSLYEGFGFPALEAMACGTPVITSDVSSLPEVAGGAGILVDPMDVGAIADAMLRLRTDAGLRDSLIKAGAEQVKRFSWDAAARQMVKLYDSMLG